MEHSIKNIFYKDSGSVQIEYDSLLDEVQKYIMTNHSQSVISNSDSAGERLKVLIHAYITDRRYYVDDTTLDELVDRLYDDMAGYSFIGDLIHQEGVEEINLNSWNDIEVIVSGGRPIKVPNSFASPQQAVDIVRRMLASCGKLIDDTVPMALGQIEKNIRIAVEKTPIVDEDVGVSASIRIVNQQSVSEQKLINSGSASVEMLAFLKACIRYGVSVCIAGATGSGKTTIMAWLLSCIPDNFRLVTIEDGSREFNLVRTDNSGKRLNSVTHLLTRHHEKPELDIDQEKLLEQTLRKHPDIIGVGEIRAAAECMSVAEASRTGHTCATTLHANSSAASYARMMTLAKLKNNIADDVLMNIMIEAFPIIVYTQQLIDGSRRITEIIEGHGYHNGSLDYSTLFSFNVDSNSKSKDGTIKIVGEHRCVGQISDKLHEQMLRRGITDAELKTFESREKI